MSQEFYDPLVQTASKIAEEYAVSVSDVLGLLHQAEKDEELVQQVLAVSLNEEGMGAIRGLDRRSDLLEHARRLLQSARDGQSGPEMQ